MIQLLFNAANADLAWADLVVGIILAFLAGYGVLSYFDAKDEKGPGWWGEFGSLIVLALAVLDAGYGVCVLRYGVTPVEVVAKLETAKKEKDTALAEAKTQEAAAKKAKEDEVAGIANAKKDADKDVLAAKTQAAKDTEAAKAEAAKAIALAKVPPPPIAAPTAVWDPATKKLAVSDPPADGKWFLQIGFKDGKPAATGFLPAKEIEIKTGTPVLVGWYRDAGGRIEQSPSAPVAVAELKKKD